MDTNKGNLTSLWNIDPCLKATLPLCSSNKQLRVTILNTRYIINILIVLENK